MSFLHDNVSKAVEELGYAVVAVAPLDLLSHRLQHRDHTGGSVSELIDRSDNGLLLTTQATYWHLLNPWHPDCTSKELEALWWVLEGYGKARDASIADSRAVCLELTAAVWVRLELKYHNWPFRILHVPPEADQRRLLNKEFYEDTAACCLDPWVSEPLKLGLGCADDLDLPEIMQLRLELGRDLVKTTNMDLEGLLSEVKSAVPFSKRSPNSERVAYLATLAQRMKDHLARGRLDSRGPAPRDQMLAADVPLEHRRAAAAASRLDPSWLWTQMAKFHRENPKASLRDLRDQWRGMVKRVGRRQDGPVDASNVAQGTAEELEGIQPPEISRLLDIGNEAWPTRPEIIHDYVQGHFCHEVAGTAGIARKVERIRKVEASRLIVRDAQDIPDSRLFSHRHPCGDAHPGLCATRDAKIYSSALKLAKSIESALSADWLHKFFALMDQDA